MRNFRPTEEKSHSRDEHVPSFDAEAPSKYEQSLVHVCCVYHRLELLMEKNDWWWVAADTDYSVSRLSIIFSATIRRNGKQ